VGQDERIGQVVHLNYLKYSCDVDRGPFTAKETGEPRRPKRFQSENLFYRWRIEKVRWPIGQSGEDILRGPSISGGQEAIAATACNARNSLSGH
jgi:hypothetical protein